MISTYKLRIWWRKKRFQHSIVIKCPTGWTKPDYLGNFKNSSDPNDHFRPWLELHCGKQGVDWDWIMIEDGQYLRVYIYDRKMASLFALVWL